MSAFGTKRTSLIRAHWEWAGGYAMLWIVVALLVFGGVYAVLDYLGADENVRTQSLVVLAAITVVNPFGGPLSVRRRHVSN